MAHDRNGRRNGRPKVFGIGLNKTGTTTLAACLKILGYDRHCGYSHDLLEQYRSGKLELIFATLDVHDSFEAEHIAMYTSHNEGVVDFFQERTASDVLLEICWEQGDGWQELCQFLKLPVPACPFPHENSGMMPIPTAREAENRRRIDQQMRSR